MARLWLAWRPSPPPPCPPFSIPPNLLSSASRGPTHTQSQSYMEWTQQGYACVEHVRVNFKAVWNTSG
eukprot:351297-Chlamydomonas_euryale.AAC.4